ncbi:MAG: ferredoxin [Novipirellula sp. JB048]
MKWLANFLIASATLATASAAEAGSCLPLGGCSDPCAGGARHVSACSGGAHSAAACSSVGCGTVLGSAAAANFPAGESICTAVKNYRVVLVPKYVTESRVVCVTENREEVRQRTKTVYKTVPVTEERYRTKVVNTPVTETKTVEYSVLVPEKSEKTVEVKESVPVWVEVPEEYTVRVPELVEVPEKYTVKVPQLQDTSFTYTVSVPHAVTEKRMHTVVNAVPVTKTRTIEVCVPKTTMQTVTKDYGHWEEQVVAAASAPAVNGSPGCGNGMMGGCGPAVVSRGRGCGLLRGHCKHSRGRCGSSCGSVCGSSACGSSACGGGNPGAAIAGAGCAAGACGSGTTTKRVWVPNVITEQVPVSSVSSRSEEVSYTVYEQQSEQVPYECTKIVYRPETRTGTKKTVVYVDEVRTRMRKVVKYNDEVRTRMRKELRYQTVTKTETIPHVSYRTEQRTKEVNYTYNVPKHVVEPYTVTRYDRVAEEQVEEYKVCVPVVVTKEQKVQVCKMVPSLVEEVVNLCCDSPASACAGNACDSGAAGCGDASGCSSCGHGCGKHAGCKLLKRAGACKSCDTTAATCACGS